MSCNILVTASTDCPAGCTATALPDLSKLSCQTISNWVDTAGRGGQGGIAVTRTISAGAALASNDVSAAAAGNAVVTQTSVRVITAVGTTTASFSYSPTTRKTSGVTTSTPTSMTTSPTPTSTASTTEIRDNKPWIQTTPGWITLFFIILLVLIMAILGAWFWRRRKMKKTTENDERDVGNWRGVPHTIPYSSLQPPPLFSPQGTPLVPAKGPPIPTPIHDTQIHHRDIRDQRIDTGITSIRQPDPEKEAAEARHKEAERKGAADAVTSWEGNPGDRRMISEDIMEGPDQYAAGVERMDRMGQRWDPDVKRGVPDIPPKDPRRRAPTVEESGQSEVKVKVLRGRPPRGGGRGKWRGRMPPPVATHEEIVAIGKGMEGGDRELWGFEEGKERRDAVAAVVVNPSVHDDEEQHRDSQQRHSLNASQRSESPGFTPSRVEPDAAESTESLVPAQWLETPDRHGVESTESLSLSRASSIYSARSESPELPPRAARHLPLFAGNESRPWERYRESPGVQGRAWGPPHKGAIRGEHAVKLAPRIETNEEIMKGRGERLREMGW